jgi:phosphoglycolate phosphatase
MKKTLIFDFDGTLADSFELVIDIAHELTGVPQQTEEEIARLRRLPLIKATRQLGIPVRKLPVMLVKGRQMMHERINEVHPFPGVADALRELKNADFHMLVTSSNSEQNVRIFLRANGLEQYFDGVYGGASIISKVGAIKQVLKRNRLSAANCYYIGDEVRDVVAASKAGVMPIAVTWGYQDAQALKDHHPYALVNKPAELIALLRAEL